MWTVSQWVAQWTANSGDDWTWLVNADKTDSWMLYETGYRVEGWLSMYLATGDPSYLSAMFTIAEAWIAGASQCDTLPGSYHESNRYGWISKTHPGGSNNDQFPLFESYGWRMFSRLLWVSRNEPSLATRWASLRDWTDANIWTKWYDRGLANLYRSNTHMASHWAVIGMYVASLSTSPTLRSQGDTVARNIMYAGIPVGITGQGNSILGQLKMRSNPANPSAAWWDWGWGDSDLPGSDVTHGEAVATACLYAYEQGYPGFNSSLMRSFAVLFDKVLWSGDVYYVDGSPNTVPPKPKGTMWHDGYAKFGMFDTCLQHRSPTHPRTTGSGSGSGAAWYIGNAAWAQQVLDECRLREPGQCWLCRCWWWRCGIRLWWRTWSRFWSTWIARASKLLRRRPG